MTFALFISEYNIEIKVLYILHRHFDATVYYKHKTLSSKLTSNRHLIPSSVRNHHSDHRTADRQWSSNSEGCREILKFHDTHTKHISLLKRVLKHVVLRHERFARRRLFEVIEVMHEIIHNRTLSSRGVGHVDDYRHRVGVEHIANHDKGDGHHDDDNHQHDNDIHHLLQLLVGLLLLGVQMRLQLGADAIQDTVNDTLIERRANDESIIVG